MSAAADGDKSAANELLPLVYEQLRRTAESDLRRERPDHTLSATALVHEAYLRLVGPREVPWANRSHFYAAAASTSAWRSAPTSPAWPGPGPNKSWQSTKRSGASRSRTRKPQPWFGCGSTRA